MMGLWKVIEDIWSNKWVHLILVVAVLLYIIRLALVFLTGAVVLSKK